MDGALRQPPFRAPRGKPKCFASRLNVTYVCREHCRIASEKRLCKRGVVRSVSTPFQDSRRAARMRLAKVGIRGTVAAKDNYG